MKKAFTLIELLAVIVILAILALIVSPIISGVISDAKKASAERSTEGYIKAAEYAQVQYQYKNDGIITNDINKLSISAQGIDKVTVNSIEFNTSGIVTSAKITVDGYTCNYLNGKVTCKIIIPSPNIALINALKNDDSSGLVADSNEPGRYYFRGVNPKNIIMLQESTGLIPYRIISFEADETIKVVREERIDTNGIEWDTTTTRNLTQDTYCTSSSSFGCNAWGNQYNTYRNGALMNDYYSLQYYASSTSTNMSIQGSEIDSKTTVTKDSNLNEYLNSTYLTTNLTPISNYIDEHMWDVGAVNYVTGKSFEKDIEESKANQWKGHIALPSIIDYKNASDNTAQCINIYSSANKISGTSYYPCTQNSDGNINNFFYKSSYVQWTLSAYASDRLRVWHVSWSGYFDANLANRPFGVHPSFYLKSTIKLTGEGIEGNEFKITES